MTLKIEYVDFMPEKKEDGILYVSHMFELAIHKCPCGCGTQAVTPFGANGWELSRFEGLITLSPSLLNNGCGSHYWIRENQVVWA